MKSAYQVFTGSKEKTGFAMFEELELLELLTLQKESKLRELRLAQTDSEARETLFSILSSN